MRTSYFFLTIFAVVGITAGYYVMEAEPITYETPAPIVASCFDFACIVELRTQEIYERDHLKYMEDARLTALQELNLEAQDMVYVSPYITTQNN